MRNLIRQRASVCLSFLAALLLAACAGEAPTPAAGVAATPAPTPAPSPTLAPPPTPPPPMDSPATPPPAVGPADLQVKPHFFARSAGGELVDARGDPDLVLEHQGKVKVRLRHGDEVRYLDPLAFQSQRLGEHPVEKVRRLQTLGVPVDPELAARLQASSLNDGLFQALSYQYLPGRDTGGVIAEVFPDGTFLVILSQTPQEWQSDRPGVASPTHLHVNPRALTARTSPLAQEYEAEILALPFDQQRYPDAALARKQCQVYTESVQDREYRELLDAVGFRFTVSHVLPEGDGADQVFGERFSALLRAGSGEGTRYFGYEAQWIGERLADLQVDWLGECDTAGGLRKYQLQDDPRDRYFAVVRRSLEPDKTRRYRIVSILDDGSARELYTAPGIILMAHPLPYDDQRWIVSTEGWRAPGDDAPADPRWQSVYLVNVNNPDEYHKVNYPISQFPRAPEAGLYGVSPLLSADRRYLFNTLYGGSDEGGGIWVADLSQEDYYQRSDRFSRIVGWDHTLSWTVLGDDPDQPSPWLNLFMTGKEVADDFAMTANILRIRNAGLDSTIEHQERLLQMVGWNPVPFAIQRISDTQFLVGVETHFNYESSLMPRAKGVYLVPVDLGALGDGSGSP